jgi:hypothetical protein
MNEKSPISESMRQAFPELARFVNLNPTKETLINLAVAHKLAFSKLASILVTGNTVNDLLLAQDRVGIAITDQQKLVYRSLEEYLEHNKVNQRLTETV